MATRVKVKRAELLTVVEGRLRKMANEDKRRKEAFPAQLIEWEQKAVAALKKAAADAEKGKLPKQGRYGDGLVIPLSPKPALSSTTRDRCRLERVAKTLKIAAEDTIYLAPDDADDYFGPCATNGSR